jgi:muramoyltetrapeptide carboxypeptidase
VIGVAAPAGPFERPVFERGRRALCEMGFEVVVPPEAFAAAGFLAGPDAQRAALFNRLISDPAVDAVICARGGYGCLRILPHIDYDAAARDPKPVIGFSDVTALLWALYARAGLIGFHGPLVTTLADASAADRHLLRSAVMDAERLHLGFEDAVALRPGTARGPLAGGNLTTLCHLLGTPYAPVFRDHILFLEERGEAPYRIDRMLTQMRMAGCFEGMRGLVLGSFTDCGDEAELRRVLAEAFDDADGPILAGVGAGHGEANATLPLGAEVVLDADGRRLDFECPTAG